MFLQSALKAIGKLDICFGENRELPLPGKHYELFDERAGTTEEIGHAR